MLTRERGRVSPILEVAALLSMLPLRCLHAGEAWEKKPFTEWTASEAIKVLTDSPWSKLVMVQGPGGQATVRTPSVLSSPTPSAERCSSCGGRGDVATPDSAVFDSDSGWGSVPGRQVVYHRVLLFSSARVRQALVRLAQLEGATVHPQILNGLQRPLEDYAIALAGPFVSAFQDASLAGLKASTYLRSRRKNGAKFDLKLFISPKERADGMALFFFPRGAEGRPPFDVTDRQVEFVTGEGSKKIRASFKIDKMTLDGALDF